MLSIKSLTPPWPVVDYSQLDYKIQRRAQLTKENPRRK